MSTELVFELFESGVDGLVFIPEGGLDIGQRAYFLEGVEADFEGGVIELFVGCVDIFEGGGLIDDEREELERVGVGAFIAVGAHHSAYFFGVSGVELCTADIDELRVRDHDGDGDI